MITVHHLNNSRSQRILWLLEELRTPYEIVYYFRDELTHRAPESLRQVHPLGRAPVIVDDDKIIAESGAIIDYILRHYGKERLTPPPGSRDYDQYVEWLHYAEGSLSLPIMLTLLRRMLSQDAKFDGMVDYMRADQLSYLETHLERADYLVGEAFSAADINVTFLLEALADSELLGSYPHLMRYVARMRNRDGYKRAIDRGGPQSLQFE